MLEGDLGDAIKVAVGWCVGWACDTVNQFVGWCVWKGSKGSAKSGPVRGAEGALLCCLSGAMNPGHKWAAQGTLQRSSAPVVEARQAKSAPRSSGRLGEAEGGRGGIQECGQDRGKAVVEVLGGGHPLPY